MEHFGKEVRELKASLKQMDKKMKAAPQDFKKQMDEFMEVMLAVLLLHKIWYACVVDG